MCGMVEISYYGFAEIHNLSIVNRKEYSRITKYKFNKIPIAFDVTPQLNIKSITNHIIYCVTIIIDQFRIGVLRNLIDFSTRI